jgi:ribosome maturation factor RimP
VSVAERVRDAVEPWLTSHDLQLYDVEHAGGIVRVLVDRDGDGGVDLDALAAATRAISSILDDVDPVPGRYTLEVSTPGLERPLRTEAHFAGAVGSKVTVKVRTGEERRVAGTLTSSDDDGITVTTDGGDERRIAYADIEKARTVFEWGPAPKPGKSTSRTKKRAAKT